jgi:hypothetical protein
MNSLQSLGANVALCCIAVLFCSFCASAQTPPIESDEPVFRWEVLPVDDDAELLTLFLRQSELENAAPPIPPEIPILSVLRDTLGSADREVHRLRYVWVHTYTSPSLKQRIASAIPFLYSRFGNAPTDRDGPAPYVVDLSNPHGPLWKRVREGLFRVLPYYPRPPFFDSTIRSYRRNQSRYRNAQLARTSKLLDSLDSLEGHKSGLTQPEVREVQSRFAQAQNVFSHLLDQRDLERMYLSEMAAMRLRCAQNWELLRQRAEAEGLHFDPLLLPDGTATHALLWVSKEDLDRNEGRRFNNRFLNIGNPWTDRVLRNWKGLTQTRYFDSDGRHAEEQTSQARKVELIPLAVYGLDHPRIPALLVDFRKPLNAKRRELSARARDVATETLIPVSTLTRIGRGAMNFIMHRKGADIFQRSRFGAYSQLKTVLALNKEMNSLLRNEIARRAEFVADNPFENDVKTELQIAAKQYQSLLSYASRGEGLRSALQRDRRTELASFAHDGLPRMFLKVAELTSLGIYRHREKNRPELGLVLEAHRRNLKYEQLIRAAAKSGPALDVMWDQQKVRRALGHMAAAEVVREHELIRLAGQIFSATVDEETKRLSMDIIQRLGSDESVGLTN